MARPRFEIRTSEKLYMRHLIGDVVFDTYVDENIKEYSMWFEDEDVGYTPDSIVSICPTEDVFDQRVLFAS